MNYDLCSVLDNQKALKTLAIHFPLHSKLKKTQGLFMDFQWKSRTFKGKMEFKGFSRTSTEIQGLLRLGKPWNHDYNRVWITVTFKLLLFGGAGSRGKEKQRKHWFERYV